MGSEWEETTLGQVVKDGGGFIQTGPFGSQLHASDYKIEGVPVIMPVNISSDRVETKGIARISKEDADRLSKHIVKSGDIVYSRRGDVKRKALITDDESGMFCGTGCLLVRPGNGVNPIFLKYHLSSARNQEWIVRHAVGATMPNLNTGILAEVPLCVPPIQIQKSIAHILGTLDDKIELNRRMNETLESMARALFKSWFVDFDPVIDNALAAGNPIPEPLQARAETRRALGSQRKPLPENTQKLFPDAFVFDEEMGWIPKGWEVNGFDKIATLDTTSVKPFQQPETVWEHYSIPSFDSSGMPCFERGSEIKSNKYLVKPGAILSSKLNPDTERTWWPFLIDEEASICSTEFMQFVPLRIGEQAFIYSLIRSWPFQCNILKRVSGTTGSRQRAQPKEIAKINVIDCGATLRVKYVGFVNQMFELIRKNSIQSCELTKLRDTLLPKLLSGELRVPEAMAAAEEAIS